jgi:phosphoesterase RecJ-like protein
MINLTSELKAVKSAVIVGHIRPDGDCVGSCMGLYLYIKKYFPQVEKLDIRLEPFSPAFAFLQDIDQVKHTFEDETYDLLICLDAGDEGRLGEAVKYLKTAGRSLCIDHHISNPGYADENDIDPQASSASELVCRLLDPEKITKEMAEALYMGIINDTGVFQYSCTSPKTMEMAAMLMGKGINFTKIVEKTFFEKTYLQNQILGRALMESMLLLDKRCIVSCIHKRDMDFYHVTPMDFEGIVSQLRNTAGVDVAIFLYESGIQEFRVSMRSSEIIDVQAVASYFGGGGHKRAAGCTMQGSFHDVVNNLTKHIEEQFQEYNSYTRNY